GWKAMRHPISIRASPTGCTTSWRPGRSRCPTPSLEKSPFQAGLKWPTSFMRKSGEAPCARRTRARVESRHRRGVSLRPYQQWSGGMMDGHLIEFTAPGGTATARLFKPAKGTSRAGVVLYMDLFGVRASLASMAARLAGEGYTVLLPDLYYRQPDHGDFDP